MKVRRVTIHGRERYRVDCGLIDGKHKQVTFATQQEAENYLAIAKSQKELFGRKGLVAYLAIKSAERHDIVCAKAAKTAARIDDSWEDIMAFYVKNRPKKAMVDIRDAATAFLKAKRDQRIPRKVCERHLKNLEGHLNAFVEEHPKRKAHEFNETLITDYLGDFDNDYTHNNHFATLATMFTFCVESGWCLESPCAKLKKIKVGEETPEVYTNAEVQLLLDTAAGDPELRPILPALAIALFGFLRIAEVKRLTREEIKLRPIHPIITVVPSKAKTKSLRNVTISPNLRVILENSDLPLNPKAKIAPADFDWRREQLHKRAGVPWRRNALRHTGASNHCVRPFQIPYPSEDHALTSAMLGHRSPEMLFKHYLALRDPLDAIPFWLIVPKGFPAVAAESQARAA